MKKEDIILIAESDDDHFELIRKNLLQPETKNELIRFTDGQLLIEFLFNQIQKDSPRTYVLLMDVNLPTLDGVEVLEKIKKDENLKKLPVVILTARDDKNTIEQCNYFGSSTYVVKPKEKHDFAETVKKIGAFLSVIEIAPIK